MSNFEVEPPKPVKFAGYTLYPARDGSRPPPKKLKTWNDWDKCLKVKGARLVYSYPTPRTRVTPLGTRMGLSSKKNTFVPDPLLYTLTESSLEQREGMMMTVAARSA